MPAEIQFIIRSSKKALKRYDESIPPCFTPQLMGNRAYVWYSLFLIIPVEIEKYFFNIVHIVGSIKIVKLKNRPNFIVGFLSVERCKSAR